MQAFGGGSSKSSTSSTDARTAASEGSIAVGQQGKFIESGGVDLSGAGGARLGTTEISGGGDITIETADAGVLTDALGKVSELSGKFQQTLGEYAKETNISQADNLEKILQSFNQLQKEADKEGKQNRVILYIVLGLFGLLGVLFLPRFLRKRK